jgi:hypothetical protein
MASKIAAKVASLRAMLPEHRIIVLDNYDEPTSRELLSGAVRGHTVEQQRVILLNRLSEEDGDEVQTFGQVKAVGEVEAVGEAEAAGEVEAVQVPQESVDDEMMNIDDNGKGYDSEERGKYPTGYIEMKAANTRIQDQMVKMDVTPCLSFKCTESPAMNTKTSRL